MKDRISTKVLSNGAKRFGVYNAQGTLQRYEYIKLEDEPSTEGTALNRNTLLAATVQALWGLDDYATPSDLFAAITSALANIGAVGSMAQIANGAVTTEKIANGAVTTEKFAVGISELGEHTVTKSNLANSSVGIDQLVNYSVTSGKLASFAVTETKIADGAVTAAKHRSLARTITSSCTDEQIPTAKAVWQLFNSR